MNRNGNILIESIISISLVLLGLIGAFNLVSSSLRENKSVSLKATATYLAAEGIEVTKNIIDTDVQSPDNTWLQTILDNNESVLFEVAYDSAAPSFIVSTSTTPLVIDKTTGVFRYAIPGDESNETITLFSRTISATRITDPESSEQAVRVISTVEWRERGTPQKVSLETIFTNWRSD
jgi:hypothetical protein